MNTKRWHWIETELVWASRREWRTAQIQHYQPQEAAILWLVLEGSIEVECAGQSYLITSGEACWQPPGKGRIVRCAEAVTWQSMALKVRVPGYDDLWPDLMSPHVWSPRGDEFLLFKAGWQQIEAHQFSSAPADILRVEGLLHWMLGMCLSQVSSPDAQPLAGQRPGWLQTALGVIEAEPQLDLGQLAAHIGYSPTQFRALFRQMTGTSPRDYAQQCLGRRARQLLVCTDWSIDRISDELGFAASTHFARFFKRRFGDSPTHFRLRAKEQ